MTRLEMLKILLRWCPAVLGLIAITISMLGHFSIFHVLDPDRLFYDGLMSLGFSSGETITNIASLAFKAKK